jgi:hypothetical protein
MSEAPLRGVTNYECTVHDRRIAIAEIY